GLYAENAPLRLAEARAARDAGDLEALARAAHALKSMSLSLGARAVAAAASTVETAARRGEPAGDGVEALAGLLDRTLAAMGAALPAAPSAGPAEVLRQAIAAGELDVVYQPMMDRTGGFSGKVEALVRWTAAEGPRRPDDFIPELEAA